MTSASTGKLHFSGPSDSIFIPGGWVLISMYNNIH